MIEKYFFRTCRLRYSYDIKRFVLIFLLYAIFIGSRELFTSRLQHDTLQHSLHANDRVKASEIYIVDTYSDGKAINSRKCRLLMSFMMVRVHLY